MEFLLLGGVEARAGSATVALGRRQERCLLGLLLVEAGRPVRTERLVELLWGTDLPGNPRATVQTYVRRLRERLAPYAVAITTVGDGYRIDVDPLDVDYHRLKAAALGGVEGDDVRRADALRGVLALCRGPLLDGVAPEGLRRRLDPEADELRLLMTERYAEADLAAGRPDRVVGVLAGVALA